MDMENLKQKAKVAAEKTAATSKVVAQKAAQTTKVLAQKGVIAAKELSPKVVEASRNVKEKSVELGKKTAEKAKFLAAEAKKNPKQAGIAGIILLVAVLLLCLVFIGGDKKVEPKVAPAPAKIELPKKEALPTPQKVTEPVKPVVAPTEPVKEAEPVKEVIKIEPQNVVLTFEATAEKDFTYEVFYTVVREIWFDEKNALEHPGKAGTHKYSIVLPVKNIFRIRLDFGERPGQVTIKNIMLTGSQEADLNNFKRYELSSFDKTTVNDDGSFTIISTQEDPFMAYLDPLLPE